MNKQDKNNCEVCGQPLAQEAMKQYESNLQKYKKKKDELEAREEKLAANQDILEQEKQMR